MTGRYSNQLNYQTVAVSGHKYNSVFSHLKNFYAFLHKLVAPHQVGHQYLIEAFADINCHIINLVLHAFVLQLGKVGLHLLLVFLFDLRREELDLLPGLDVGVLAGPVIEVKVELVPPVIGVKQHHLVLVVAQVP